LSSVFEKFLQVNLLFIVKRYGFSPINGSFFRNPKNRIKNNIRFYLYFNRIFRRFLVKYVQKSVENSPKMLIVHSLLTISAKNLNQKFAYCPKWQNFFVRNGKM